MIKVLFVCMGNICRSPMAEAVFQDMVRKAGLQDQITSNSAGTGDWHAGETAHPRTLKILEREEIPYDGRARQIVRRDVDHFDYILMMDTENLRTAEGMVGSHPKLRMFLSYANQAGLTRVQEVPDPYYNGRYDEVYDLVSKGGTALLTHLRAEHHL